MLTYGQRIIFEVQPSWKSESRSVCLPYYLSISYRIREHNFHLHALPHILHTILYKLIHLNYKITPFFALFFMLFHTRPLLRVYVFRQPVLLPAIPTDVASHDLYGNWGRKSNLLRSTYTLTHVCIFLQAKIKTS